MSISFTLKTMGAPQYLLPRAPIESVNAVQYRLTPGSLQQRELHETVQKHDDERLIRNWFDHVTLTYKYDQHRLQFLKLLTAFEDIFDGHPGGITTAQQRIKLTYKDVRPVQSVAYKATPNGR